MAGSGKSDENLVSVYLYDVSRGLAKRLSGPLLAKEVEGLWRSSVVVDGVEYAYVPPMKFAPVQSGCQAAPDKIIPLGYTDISAHARQEIFQGLADRYTLETYDPLFHNSNTFSNEFAMLLTGSGVPEEVMSQVQDILSSPIGEAVFAAFTGGEVPPGSPLDTLPELLRDALQGIGEEEGFSRWQRGPGGHRRGGSCARDGRGRHGPWGPACGSPGRGGPAGCRFSHWGGMRGGGHRGKGPFSFGGSFSGHSGIGAMGGYGMGGLGQGGWGVQKPCWAKFGGPGRGAMMFPGAAMMFGGPGAMGGFGPFAGANWWEQFAGAHDAWNPNSCGRNGCGPNGCGFNGANACGPNNHGPNGCGPGNICGHTGCGPKAYGTRGCGPKHYGFNEVPGAADPAAAGPSGHGRAAGEPNQEGEEATGHAGTGPASAPASQRQNNKVYVHMSVRCDVCGCSPIMGVCYHSLSLPDFDACHACKDHPVTQAAGPFQVIPEGVDEEQAAVPPPVHWNVSCDICGDVPIVGVRYRSLSLPNFDTCEACQAHPVAKAAGPYKVTGQRGASKTAASDLRPQAAPSATPAHTQVAAGQRDITAKPSDPIAVPESATYGSAPEDMDTGNAPKPCDQVPHATLTRPVADAAFTQPATAVVAVTVQPFPVMPNQADDDMDISGGNVVAQVAGSGQGPDMQSDDAVGEEAGVVGDEAGVIEWVAVEPHQKTQRM